MKTIQPDTVGLELAAEALRYGEVIAYPTETVYGLGVDPFSLEALDNLYTVKGRDEHNPVLLVVADTDQLSALVSTISANASTCIKAFWPGPLSLLFPGAPELPDALLNAKGQVCVRQSSSVIVQDLCTIFGGAITSTSANRSGEAPARSPKEIQSKGISVCIDGGILAEGSPSTVFDPESCEVLREGAISGNALVELLASA